MTFISYAQNFEDVMLWRALKHVGKGFYVDVGAWDPLVDSVTKAFYERGWRGINIEPVREWFDRLVDDRPEDINLNVAILAQAGAVQLYDIPTTGLSTIDPATAQRHKEQSAFGNRLVTVPALTLTEVLENSASQDIHFLKIDVEGAEHQVLAGTDFTRFRPWIVLVEATAPLSSEANYEGWDRLLKRRRYKFVYFDGVNRFYIAQERAGLASAFSAPPNSLDDFVRASEWSTKLALDAKEVELQQAESALATKLSETVWLQGEVNAKDIQLKETRAALEEQHEFYQRGGEEQRQFYENALENTEAERQRLDGLLHARDQLVQGLQSMVSGLETDQLRLQENLLATHQHLETANLAFAATRQELEAARQDFETMRRSMVQVFESTRQALEGDLAANRNYAERLEGHIRSLDGEVAGLRTVVREVHASISWRLTAPIRLLHIREGVRKLASAVYRLLRRRPETDKLLDTVRRESPELWHAVAANIKPPLTAQPPVLESSARAPESAARQTESLAPATNSVVRAPGSLARKPVVLFAAAEDKRHFLDLFQRELARRTAGKAERGR